MGPNGKPRISRELLERMNRHSDDVQGIAAGAGLRPAVSSMRVDRRGRKHVGSYRQSAIGSRNAVFSTSPHQDGNQPVQAQSAQPGAIGLTPGSTPPPSPKPSFREPPSRGYNPYS